MNADVRLVTRVALFSALIYVLSWGTSYFPNVNLAFFVAFSAGFLWGAGPGLVVGGVGMWLWTSFNPFGPALLPVAIAQVAGMAACGLVGYFARGPIGNKPKDNLWVVLGLAGVLCTLVFYLPVMIADAWIRQPFWPAIIGGLPWMGISLASNVVIFPLFFRVTRRIYERDR
jgi:uncharacterized membrane protein